VRKAYEGKPASGRQGANEYMATGISILPSTRGSERAALIVTANLQSSQWTSVFPNPRLCEALPDRVTGRFHLQPAGRTCLQSVPALDFLRPAGGNSA
jgi:hypothetical protein